MALEVIGAGFGRTGTASLKAALEIHGYDKCFQEYPDESLAEWHERLNLSR
jgi:hypothetical protein